MPFYGLYIPTKGGAASLQGAAAASVAATSSANGNSNEVLLSGNGEIGSGELWLKDNKNLKLNC